LYLLKKETRGSHRRLPKKLQTLILLTIYILMMQNYKKNLLVMVKVWINIVKFGLIGEMELKLNPNFAV